jgi:hypothetical protein
MDFSVSSSSGGFDEQFNSGNAAHWDRESGTWSVVNSNWYFTDGIVWTSATSKYNKATYSNFDYQARLWRNGCNTCTNRILVRTSGAISDGKPSNYYALQYTREGDYSVWKRVEGSHTALQNWTASPAINKGNAWNKLRFYANGNTLRCYINDTLVWNGTDSSLSSGGVGLGMYRTNSSSNDGFYVDWAVLSVLSSTSERGRAEEDNHIDPNQKVLNKEANQIRIGNEDMSR